MVFLYHENFHKEFKKLAKKYHSLQEDFDDFLLALEVNPVWYEPNTVRIAWLWDGVVLPLYKVRKFPLTCMRLANSGIRIVYVYDSTSGKIEFIEFVEVYHKNEKENHDITLIRDCYSGIESLKGKENPNYGN